MPFIGVPGNTTNGPGWFNSNPPNLQGRVVGGQVRLGQFVLNTTDAPVTLFLKVGYNSGVVGAPVEFGQGTFVLGAVPAPGAIALLGLAGLTGRRRR
jgi:MYXO-CTERM domain-containing protein